MPLIDCAGYQRGCAVSGSGPQKTSKVAKRFFGQLTEQEPGYICREVIIEVVRVLERAYRLTRKQIVPAIEGLISSKELVVENAERVGVGVALSRYIDGGAGFSDRMILLASVDAQCSGLATFDKTLAKNPGTILLRPWEKTMQTGYPKARPKQIGHSGLPPCPSPYRRSHTQFVVVR